MDQLEIDEETGLKTTIEKNKTGNSKITNNSNEPSRTLESTADNSLANEGITYFKPVFSQITISSIVLVLTITFFGLVFSVVGMLFVVVSMLLSSTSSPLWYLNQFVHFLTNIDTGAIAHNTLRISNRGAKSNSNDNATADSHNPEEDGTEHRTDNADDGHSREEDQSNSTPATYTVRCLRVLFVVAHRWFYSYHVWPVVLLPAVVL
jgi:hypothetical protein